MRFEPYSESNLNLIINEPWEITDNTYKLHAAFAVSCLFDLMEPDDEDEGFETKDMWGQKISKRMVDRLVEDITEDFNDAADSRTPIVIFGKKYTIRKKLAYDRTRIKDIFNFETDGDLYIIRPEGIQDLSGENDPQLSNFQVTQGEAKKSRTYLRQIIKLAEDDENNGWDSLSDMEIVYYCWGLFFRKYQSENFKHFLSEYKDYIYVDPKEIQSCFNPKSELRGRPVGICPFSYDKIQEWNNRNAQPSKAIKIPEQEADDYWYDVALKGNFKPIDERGG